MLDKFNLDQIKKQTVAKLSETGGDLSDRALTIKENLITDTNTATSKARDAVNSFKDSIDETKGLVKDFGVDKVKEFAVNASTIVSEIDTYLLEKNSPYEVGSFRVSANMGVMAGMILDIQFSKTLNAKKNSFDSRAAIENKSTLPSLNIDITNPTTGKSYKVPRTALVNKEQIKIKDPATGQLLVIDVKTEKVIKVIEPS
jgi:hypothetical protein